MFQSLFCWICLLDHQFQSVYSCMVLVSILVLLDLPFGRIRRLKLLSHRHNVSILVLLDLPFGLKIALTKYTSDGGFNPCFVGSAFWTFEWNQTIPLIEYGFNPCFVGSAFWTNPLACGMGLESLFQSLFCWICLLGGSPAPIPPDVSDVSILVLLDLPFGRVKWRKNVKFAIRFNPCFVGSAFWTRKNLIFLNINL